jgi:hypothetical protein
MTSRARISQADIERAAKAAKNAGWPSARLKLDLVNGVIEMTLSTDAAAPHEPNPVYNPWDDEDV